MQTTEFFHDVQARPHPQMEGITQNDLRLNFGEVARRHALHGAIRAHRHENRRLNDAVCGGNFTATGFARGGFEFEGQCAQGKCLFRIGRILNHFKHMGLKTTF